MVDCIRRGTKVDRRLQAHLLLLVSYILSETRRTRCATHLLIPFTTSHKIYTASRKIRPTSRLNPFQVVWKRHGGCRTNGFKFLDPSLIVSRWAGSEVEIGTSQANGNYRVLTNPRTISIIGLPGVCVFFCSSRGASSHQL